MAADFENLSIRISASAKDAINKVNQLADALKSLNEQLANLDPTNMTKAANAAQDFGSAVKGMGGKKAAKDIEAVANGMSQITNSASGITQVANAHEQLAQATGHAAEASKDAAQSVGNQGKNGFQKFSDSVRNVKNSIGSTVSKIGELGKALAKVFPHANKASSGMRKMSSASKKTAITSKGLAKELLRVGKMFKLMITRMVLRQVISGIGDGFKNLAQYSSQVNASLSLLWNSFRQLGNSIAAAASPLLNAFAPALNYIIQLVIKAVNAINQLISALLGLGVWTRAKTLTDSYADSLKKAGGAAKELKKTVLGFDELNQLQDNNSGGGGGATDPADMFETVDVDDKWKKIADKIKDYWTKLVDPIKRAWARAGEYVKKSWIKAFQNIKTHIMHVADDFLEVWNQPATVNMIEDFFKIIGNIGQIVGNLASSFDRAWQKADVGKRIFENIRDVLADIIGVIEDITLSWAIWADKVNFSPLLESIERWTRSLEKPIKAVMGIVSDLNDHFIQPFTTWLVETGIPKLIDVFTEFNSKVKWDVIRERLDKLWTALEPFAEKVGEGLLIFIERVSDLLADFLNSDAWDSFVDTLIEWMEKIDAEDIADGLTMICTALLGYKALSFLTNITAAIKGLFAVLGGSEATAAAGGAGTLSTILSLVGSAGAGMLLGAGVATPIKDNLFAKWEQEAIDDGDAIGAAAFAKIRDEFDGFLGTLKLAWAGLFDWDGLENMRYAVRDANGEITAYYDMQRNLVMDIITVEEQAIAKEREQTRVFAESREILESTAKREQVFTDAIRKKNEELARTGHSYHISTSQVSEDSAKIREQLARTRTSYVGDTTSMARATKDASTLIRENTEAARQKFIDVFTNVEDESVSVGTYITNMGDTFVNQCKGISDTAEDTTKEVSKSFSEDKWTFSGITDGLKSSFESAKSAVKSIWNSIADSMNGTHSFFGSSFSINLPKIFASGGFPEDGLFMANHNELVGRFSNGKTAVANNEQITAGIAQAVYSAMISANSGGGGQYINNTIEIDGVAIARAVTKGQRSIDRRYNPTMA